MNDRTEGKSKHPEPSVIYGGAGPYPGFPGVTFVQPQHPTDSWRVTLVLVRQDILDSDYVLEAVLAYGRHERCVTAMRRAHRKWERDQLPKKLEEAARVLVGDAERVARQAAL